MMRLRYYGLLTLALILVAKSVVVADETTKKSSQASKKPYTVLFVGNSHTYFHDVPGLVASLAREARVQHPLNVTTAVQGGYTFEKHWNRNETMQKLRKTDGRDAEAPYWDIVILQGNGMGPHTHRKQTKEFGLKLAAIARQGGARLIFYQTFEYTLPQQKQHNIAPDMHAVTVATYDFLAGQTNSEIAPVGVAVRRARKERPDIQLNWKNGKDIHLSPEGAYLAACVFFSTIYKQSPVGLSATVYPTNKPVSSQDRMDPAGARVSKSKSLVQINPANAKYLQTLAWDVVQKETKQDKQKTTNASAK